MPRNTSHTASEDITFFLDAGHGRDAATAPAMPRGFHLRHPKANSLPCAQRDEGACRRKPVRGRYVLSGLCGAHNAGMEAVLFDVAGAYSDRGPPRVESLEQLETWLAQTRPR